MKTTTCDKFRAQGPCTRILRFRSWNHGLWLRFSHQCYFFMEFHPWIQFVNILEFGYFGGYFAQGSKYFGGYFAQGSKYFGYLCGLEDLSTKILNPY